MHLLTYSTFLFISVSAEWCARGGGVCLYVRVCVFVCLRVYICAKAVMKNKTDGVSFFLNSPLFSTHLFFFLSVFVFFLCGLTTKLGCTVYFLWRIWDKKEERGNKLVFRAHYSCTCERPWFLLRINFIRENANV